MAELQFGEWLPDLPPHRNRGALEAENVLPGVEGYSSMPSHDPFLAALSAEPVGMIWARSFGGTIYNIVGTRTGLFRVSGTTVTDLTQSGGYTVDNWDFTLFGNRIIAAGGLDTPIQFFDMDGTGGTTFEDLPGSPPNARYIATIRDFVVLAHARNPADQVDPDLVVWSGFNNSELWTPSRATQSDSQPLRGLGGSIQRVISGAAGTIFDEHSIWRMAYEGPPIFFRFDEIEVQRGTPAPYSVIRIGFFIFFYSQDGFYVLNTRTGRSEAIGANRVDRTFRQSIPLSEIRNMRGFIDRTNGCVIWLHKSSASIGYFDRYIAFNWKSARWSRGRVVLTFVGEFASESVTLDDLDTVLGANIDTANFNVDSTAFPDGEVGLLAFDDEFEGGTFSGAPLPWVIDTKELSDGHFVSFIHQVRPLIDGLAPNTTVTPITRDRLIDNPIVGLPVGINEIGNADVRVRARYQRYRVSGTEAFMHGTGIEAEPKRRGLR